MGKEKNYVREDGSYVVKKSKKGNILAFIVCVLIALTIWIYVANRDIIRFREDYDQMNGYQNSEIKN